MAINYFDKNNNIIQSVDKGCFYASASFLQDLTIKEGGEVELTAGDSHLTLKFMGQFKGALFQPGDANPPYLIMNSADYGYLGKEEATHIMNGKQLYINTSEVNEIRELAKNYGGAYVNTREESKSIYLYDMLSAYILMMISIVLMFTAFVVLRFTIGFTVSGEFRKIGVMKAVVIIILLFCYGCTRRVNKLLPVDAVKNGQTGERFRRKSLLHLGRSKLPQAAFLAVNDVISSPKQFSIIIERGKQVGET